MRLRRGSFQNIPARPKKYALPTLEWFGGAATGGALSSTGTLAGDLFIGLDTDADNTPPVVVATGRTWIDAGITSTESAGNASIRAAYGVAAGSNETIGAAGSSRREWVALRGVDTTLFAASLSAGVTYAYNADTGANIVSSALAFTRPGLVLLWARQSGTNTNTFTNGPVILIDDQSAGNAEVQVYWTGLSASLDTEGANILSYPGQALALTDNTRPRATFVIWVPGAEL